MLPHPSPILPRPARRVTRCRPAPRRWRQSRRRRRRVTTTTTRRDRPPVSVRWRPDWRRRGAAATRCRCRCRQRRTPPNRPPPRPPRRVTRCCRRVTTTRRNRPVACEVASGLEATRRDRDKASAPLPPEEDAAQPPGAAASQAGNPLPPGDAPVTTVRPKAWLAPMARAGTGTSYRGSSGRERGVEDATHGAAAVATPRRDATGRLRGGVRIGGDEARPRQGVGAASTRGGRRSAAWRRGWPGG